ncbi:MAG: hypothetical protein AB7K71_16710 [Polyangiaceae bacterium]
MARRTQGRAAEQRPRAARSAIWVALVTGLGLAPFTACGGPQDAGALGDECFRADDCQFGLVCDEGL